MLLGSTPVNGSSSSRKSGSVVRARASSSPPPLAARQLVGEAAAQMRQAELREQRVGAGLAGRAVQRLEFQDRQQVIAGGHLAKGAGFLRQIPHPPAGALVHGQAGDVLAAQQNLPLVGPDKTHHHVEGGGLARPVGAEQRHDLAAPHPQVHAPHHRPPPVGLGKAARQQFGGAVWGSGDGQRGGLGGHRASIAGPGEGGGRPAATFEKNE